MVVWEAKMQLNLVERIEAMTFDMQTSNASDKESRSSQDDCTLLSKPDSMTWILQLHEVLRPSLRFHRAIGKDSDRHVYLHRGQSGS